MYKAQSFHSWYIALSRGPLPKLTPPRGPQFYIELYKEKFKQLLILNRFWQFYQTQQEWSLGGPLLKLFKSF